MIEQNFIYSEAGGAPLKMWTRGVPVEDVAEQQLQKVAALPFVFKQIGVMPAVHWGMGATVGSVIATKGAIVPAAVGVDIGCGMIAARLGPTCRTRPRCASRARFRRPFAHAGRSPLAALPGRARRRPVCRY